MQMLHSPHDKPRLLHGATSLPGVIITLFSLVRAKKEAQKETSQGPLFNTVGRPSTQVDLVGTKPTTR